MIALYDVLEDLQAAVRSQSRESATALLRQVFPGMLDKHLVKAIVDLAASAERKGHTDRAMRYYRLAVDLHEACFPSAEIDARAAMHSMVNLLRMQDNEAEAQLFLEKLRVGLEP